MQYHLCFVWRTGKKVRVAEDSLDEAKARATMIAEDIMVEDDASEVTVEIIDEQGNSTEIFVN